MSFSFRFLLYALIVSVLMNGCTSAPVPQAKPKVLPAWINAPLPEDNELYMYGLGIEKDRDSAIKAALSDMVSKLGTTIESSYQSNQEVQGSYVKSNIKNQIKSDISKIKINNYKVIKSHKISYREFAVMIQSDKKKFIHGLKENLENSKKSISKKYSAIKNSDVLTRYNTKKELLKEASKLLSEIFIISELDKSFNKIQNLNFVSSRHEDFLNESKNLKFYVSSDHKSSKFSESIKNYIAQNGFNVVNSNNNAINIVLKTKESINKNGIFPIAVLTLNVGVYDGSKRIGGKSLILKEKYNGSMNSVYKNASIHLEQDIKSMGINEVIGINLKIE